MRHLQHSQPTNVDTVRQDSNPFSTTLIESTGRLCLKAEALSNVVLSSEFSNIQSPVIVSPHRPQRIQKWQLGKIQKTRRGLCCMCARGWELFPTLCIHAFLSQQHLDCLVLPAVNQSEQAFGSILAFKCSAQRAGFGNQNSHLNRAAERLHLGSNRSSNGSSQISQALFQ